MNEPIIAGNWKMNANLQETRTKLNELLEGLKNIPEESRPRVLIAPQNLALAAASEAVSNSRDLIQLMAQNAHWEESGAFTGENSLQVIRDLGIKWCLIGHSERRHLFGEDLKLIQERVEGLLKKDLSVMLCVGETLEERDGGLIQDTLFKQLSTALKNLVKANPGIGSPKEGRLLIAYEPVWAIGTGKTASPDQANEAHQWIKEWFENQGATRPRVLYGGSAKPENAGQLLSQKEIDGILVGGASLKPDSFLEMITAARK